jgi:prepilin-type N-terminal cleavage/methylation domain-containing protein
MNARQTRRHGFSLVEVIVAIGLIAVVLVALLASFGPAARSAGDAADAEVAARLAGNIQIELERLQAELGLEGLAAAVPPAGSATPLQLVATRDGQRVLRADGPAPAADHALDDPTLPGIAERDRYYLAEVTQQLNLPYAAGAGFLAVSVRVQWPDRLPAGPPTPGAARPDADPSREVPAEERNWMVFNFALRP